MNKKLSLFVFAALIVVAGILVYKNRTEVTHYDTALIDDTSNGKTETLHTGQQFTVTLPNPGDGGYQFDNPEYDTSLMHLDDHTHLAPESNVPLGNFGTDVWTFSALKAGATDLTITSSRSWNGEKGNTFKTSLLIK